MKRRLLQRIAGRLVPAVKPPVALPDDFDWKFYLDYYPDLRTAGLRTEQDAASHYVWHGFFEKRFTRPQDRDLMDRYEEIRRSQLENISRFDERCFRVIGNERRTAEVRVSVVISLYNYERYIEGCLRSVLAGSLRDIEIVIVNDASSDGSRERCMPFLDCDVPVTILDKTINTGVAHSRNLGIRQARGDYVFILDADNEIYSSCLAQHLACMHASRGQIACYGVIEIFDEHGAYCGQFSHIPFDYPRLLAGNYIDAMAMFDRRELIDIGMYDERLLERGIGYEDYELWLRIGSRGRQVGFIDTPLGRYLKKNESMMSIVRRYYHVPLVSFLMRTYGAQNSGSVRTVVLVTGMHRSGTSALAGVIGLMGADTGADLIGPDRSNARGHFEPRKIVALNDGLLERLEARAPGSGDLPLDWMAHAATKQVRHELKEIIAGDFSRRDIFMIKDPRLCLLLPLYLDVFEELCIDARVVVIRRDPREVVRSLHERDGMKPDLARAYCDKHVRALEQNLAGREYLALSFDRLIEDPAASVQRIAAFIPELAGYDRDAMQRHILDFVDPGLRHHRVSDTKGAKARRARVRQARQGGRGAGPDFMIIGAQRAGTTFLYHCLCLHPQILSASTKELHWFHAGPADGDSYHTGHLDREWYERQFPKKPGLLAGLMRRRAVLSFEATPEYLFHPVVPVQVFRLYPRVKLIVLVRDPIERAVSQYYHERRAGCIDPDISIEEYFARDRLIAAEEEPKLMSDPRYYSHAYEHCCPVSRSDYGRQIARWLRYFPREQMLILGSEAMFADPCAALGRVCDFLDIDNCSRMPAYIPPALNSSDRSPLSSEQRTRLAAYFPFGLAVEKFCTPTSCS